ncbi:MAG: acyl-ACP--UDP-N-acetylglucosamine O-acyltransferase [Candidatus Omnitrophica bacterium]|nr:acyl-ACP--UDP-N-acetylglucosamine O-acyltransferase [Candidatus Omnitrophota bacterium]
MSVEFAQGQIHSTAIVHPDAQLAEGVDVGPYSIVGEHVKIGSGTRIGAHAVIDGYTTIGEDNNIFTGAVIGSVTQDKKYRGGKSFVRIGDRNNVREYVTVNPGTEDGSSTIIGNDNLLMAYSHVAHDCVVKNHAVLANVATLAGYVTIEDRAIVGGLSAVHQFVRIGKLAIVGGCSKVVQDIPPFIMADGHPAKAFGLNSVGFERNGISKEERLELKRAFKIIFRSKLSLSHAVQRIEADLKKLPAIIDLLSFLKSSERGTCK